MKHLNKETADKYLCGDIGALKKLQLKAHLKQCSECRDLIKQIKEDNLLLSEIKTAVKQQSESDDSPEERETINRLKAELGA